MASTDMNKQRLLLTAARAPCYDEPVDNSLITVHIAIRDGSVCNVI